MIAAGLFPSAESHPFYPQRDDFVTEGVVHPEREPEQEPKREHGHQDSIRANQTVSDVLMKLAELDLRERKARWQTIFIAAVSTAAIGVDFSLINNNAVNGMPTTIFFSTLLAIGIGGIASLFGGTSHVSLKKWGKFSGVAALIIALIIIILNAFGLIRIKDIAALPAHQIDSSTARAFAELNKMLDRCRGVA